MFAVNRILWIVSLLLIAGAVLAFVYLHVRRPWSTLSLGVALLLAVPAAAVLGLLVHRLRDWRILLEPILWVPLVFVAAAPWIKRGISRKSG